MLYAARRETQPVQMGEIKIPLHVCLSSLLVVRDSGTALGACPGMLTIALRAYDSLCNITCFEANVTLMHHSP